MFRIAADTDPYCPVCLAEADRHAVNCELNPDRAEPRTRRVIAWEQALTLFDRWETAATNHNGWGHRTAEADLRGRLDAVIAENGWQGTRIDPLVSWAARRGMSTSAPA